MANVKLLKDNDENFTELWLPDKDKCTAQEELRRIEEWKRSFGGKKRPSELGIHNYIYGNGLHPKFFEGRNPPPVALDSAENLEWYTEQLTRCIYGYEYKGVRISGDYYWFLNFTPFLVAQKDEDGEVTNNFEISFPYFSHQHDYIFKLIEEAHHYGKAFMMMGGRGYGKQQPDSETVITPTGKTTMGSLRPGDYVVGYDGNPKKVLQIHPQGKDDVYEVTLKDGRKIRCGKEHLWTVYNYHGRLITMELKDMFLDYKKDWYNGTAYKYYIPTGNGADYSYKNLPVSPYFLGALLGDGSMSKDSIRLVIVENEQEILDKILKDEKLTVEDYSVKDETTLHGKTKVYRVYFKRRTGLLKKLKRLNLVGVSLYDKFIPKEYLLSSREQRMDLLRGLMDTDGYCSKKGKIEFTNTSKSLAEDVVDLARSLGIKASISIENRNNGINSTCYRVRLYTGLDIFYLSRKRKLLNKTPNVRIQQHRDRTAIVDIKKLDYKEHSTCITVDSSDSLYLTTDYTVTHNTYIALSILAKYYYLKPESNNIVSASSSRHADEAFGIKLKRMLLAIDEAHPTLALARLTDTKYVIKSGYEVNIDGVKRETGPLSTIQEVIYGDNPDATRGSRPDTQLLEECMAPGTRVLMADNSIKNIEDIKVGDVVRTATFKKRKVARVTSGTSMMYRVKQSIGKDYVVNGKHLLRVSYYDEFGELQQVNIRAEDFVKRDDQENFYGVRVDTKKPDITVTEEGVGEYYGFTIAAEKPGEDLFILADGTVTHNCGAWSTGKADLKKCLAASEGSWKVGSIYKCRVFLIGTGGSVSTDQAKDVFTNPDAFNVLAVNDFTLKQGKKHAVFIPADFLYGGAGWERTGVNNNEWARADLDAQRELKKDDAEIYDKFTQEYPYTVEEVFKKSGTNIFHQRNIAKQWTDIQFGADHIITPEIGYLEWKRSESGKIIGVEWAKNPNGNIHIVEQPYHGKGNNIVFPDLYVAGIDSIDQGQLDSTTSKDRSSLAMLVKKRLVDGEYFSQSSNLYVAKYIGRSLDVRDDYEEALKLALYYSAKVNIEYTKIGIVQYFRERKKWDLFMKRPMIARSSAGSGELEYIKRLREQSLIGTTTAQNVIDYGDGKIKEYTRDYCHSIFFVDLLEQLRDYQREDRTKFDLVIAMALCEIADEDMLGEPARPNGSETKEFQEFGYYTDENGFKKFGVIPQAKKKIEAYLKEENQNGFRWIDMKGQPRFDDRFDILDKRDLNADDYLI